MENMVVSVHLASKTIQMQGRDANSRTMLTPEENTDSLYNYAAVQVTNVVTTSSETALLDFIVMDSCWLVAIEWIPTTQLTQMVLVVKDVRKLCTNLMHFVPERNVFARPSYSSSTHVLLLEKVSHDPSWNLNKKRGRNR